MFVDHSQIETAPFITVLEPSASAAVVAALSAQRAQKPNTMKALDLRITYSFSTASEDDWVIKTHQFDMVASQEMLRSPKKFNAKALAWARNHFNMVHRLCIMPGYAVFPATIKIKNVEVVAVNDLPVNP
jgi:hypothetical protein